MDDKPTSDEKKFDEILRRMLTVKPLSKAELSAKLKAEREANKIKARPTGKSK